MQAAGRLLIQPAGAAPPSLPPAAAPPRAFAQQQRAAAAGAAAAAAPAADSSAAGSSFNDLPAELQRRITDLVPGRAHRATLRASCAAACAAVSAAARELAVDCGPSPSAAPALQRLVACCTQWRDLRCLRLRGLQAHHAPCLWVLLAVSSRHCPLLTELWLELASSTASVAILSACATVAGGAAPPSYELPPSITALSLSLCPGGGAARPLLLAPLRTLTKLTSLRLAAAVHPASGYTWLPPGLRRLALGDVGGGEWLDAVACCCSGSLEELELDGVPDSDWRFGTVIDKMLQLIPELSRLVSAAGWCGLTDVGRIPVYPSQLPPGLRRLLLYSRSANGALLPFVIRNWQLLSDATPGLEDLACTLIDDHITTAPRLARLRQLHVSATSPFFNLDLHAHFPALEVMKFGDADPNYPTAWPTLACLARCTRLTRLCLATTGFVDAAATGSVRALAQLPALRELELLGDTQLIYDLGLRPWSFCEFEAIARAPQLARLVLHRFNQGDPFAAAKAGWPFQRAVAAAALQAAAGDGLCVEFDADIDWQPSLLPSAASVEEL